MNRLGGLLNRLRRETAPQPITESLETSSNNSSIHKSKPQCDTSNEKIVEITLEHENDDSKSVDQTSLSSASGPNTPQSKLTRNKSRKERQKLKRKHFKELSLCNLPRLNEDVLETINALQESNNSQPKQSIHDQNGSKSSVVKLKSLLDGLESGKIEIEGMTTETKQLASQLAFQLTSLINNSLSDSDSEMSSSLSNIESDTISSDLKEQNLQSNSKSVTSALELPETFSTQMEQQNSLLNDLNHMETKQIDLEQETAAIVGLETKSDIPEAQQSNSLEAMDISLQTNVNEDKSHVINDDLMDVQTDTVEMDGVGENVPVEYPPFIAPEPIYFDWEKTDVWFKVNKDNLNMNNFIKSCKWSPTGDRIATSSEDSRLRVYAMPGPETNLEDNKYLKSDPIVLVTAEEIYDWAWYPYSNVELEGSSLIATSCRDQPVQLWDATNGTLRASYRAYDDADAITSALSICFTNRSNKLVAGFREAIRVFDLSRPGRECYRYSTVKSTMKRNGSFLREVPDNMKLPGLISTICVSPDYSEMIACGSFNSKVVLYHENRATPLMSLDGIDKDCGGITQVQFTPDGQYLCAGARRDSNIYCWDLRNPSHYLWKVQRQATNGQRIGFDIHRSGSYLGTASQDGVVKIWDLKNPDQDGNPAKVSSNLPTCTDVINSFQFHPLYPMWAFSTGQRRYPIDEKNVFDGYSSDSSSSSSSSSSDKEENPTTPTNELVVGYCGVNM